MPISYSSRYLGLTLSLLLLGIGLLLGIVFEPTTLQSQSLVIPLDAQRYLVGKLYTPKTTTAPYPVMLLCHGVKSTKEMMAPLGIELARHGIAALAFDSGGFGESYDRSYSEVENLADAKAVVAFLRTQKGRFNPNRIGIAGHSMGGTTALTLALEDKHLRATVVLGMRGQVSTVVPPNLLLAIGLYEQFHPLAGMREMLQTATEREVGEFQLSGDFTKSTARMLVVSPTADHLIEPFDPLLIQQTVAWAERALDVPTSNLALLVPGLVLGHFLTFVAGLATSGYLVKEFLAGQRWHRFLPWGIFAIALTSLGLGVRGWLSSLWASNLILFCYFLLLLSNYVRLTPNKFSSALRLVFLYSALFLVSYALIAVGGTAGELITHPLYWLSLPQFLFQWPIILIYSRYVELRAALFPIYSFGLQPSYLLAIGVLPELLKPGIFLRGFESIAVCIVRWLRQPLIVSKSQISRRSFSLLLLLIMILVALLYQRAKVGVLGGEMTVIAIEVVSKVLLMPGVLIVLLLRCQWFQQLEKRCIQLS